MINSLKLQTHQQKDGDGQVDSVVTGLREKSRKGVMDGLRNLIELVGGLCQGTKSVKVVKPQFTADFPEAVIGEGGEELILRAEEVG